MRLAGLEALLQEDGFVGEAGRAAVEAVEESREEMIGIDLAQQVDDGDVWRLFEDVPELAASCSALLSENASFLLLNAYAARISGLSLAHLLAENLKDRSGQIDWGELALAEEFTERGIGLSFFARWRRNAP